MNIYSTPGKCCYWLNALARGNRVTAGRARGGTVRNRVKIRRKEEEKPALNYYYVVGSMLV
jgi:hypothetical protein